jgi:UDP-2,4-diacetamido-2,4,6-trideoxy-beta-L-altropyranose hydrolase
LAKKWWTAAALVACRRNSCGPGNDEAETDIVTPKKSLTLRRAEDADSRLYWEWANEPLIRQASFSSEPIPWETHAEWFEKKRRDPNCVLFVFEQKGDPVGQVRLERTGENQAVMSVSLDKRYRGQGLGSRLIRMAARAYLEISPVERVHAYVKYGNEASSRAFLKAGYTELKPVRIKGQPARHFVLKKDA